MLFVVVVDGYCCCGRCGTGCRLPQFLLHRHVRGQLSICTAACNQPDRPHIFQQLFCNGRKHTLPRTTCSRKRRNLELERSTSWYDDCWPFCFDLSGCVLSMILLTDLKHTACCLLSPGSPRSNNTARPHISPRYQSTRPGASICNQETKKGVR